MRKRKVTVALSELPVRSKNLTQNDLEHLYGGCAGKNHSCDACGPKCCDGLKCRGSDIMGYNCIPD
jgi:hypothetical protein